MAFSDHHRFNMHDARMILQQLISLQESWPGKRISVLFTEKDLWCDPDFCKTMIWQGLQGHKSQMTSVRKLQQTTCIYVLKCTLHLYDANGCKLEELRNLLRHVLQPLPVYD